MDSKEWMLCEGTLGSDFHFVWKGDLAKIPKKYKALLQTVGGFPESIDICVRMPEGHHVILKRCVPEKETERGETK